MGSPLRANNYIPAGKSRRCVYWDGSKGYGNFRDKCRYCVHRPLFTDDCEIEKSLQGAEK